MNENVNYIIDNDYVLQKIGIIIDNHNIPINSIMRIIQHGFSYYQKHQFTVEWTLPDNTTITHKTSKEFIDNLINGEILIIKQYIPTTQSNFNAGDIVIDDDNTIIRIDKPIYEPSTKTWNYFAHYLSSKLRWRQYEMLIDEKYLRYINNEEFNMEINHNNYKIRIEKER